MTLDFSQTAFFVVLMMLATQLSRLAPLMISHLEISPQFERWLGHIPIAILAALVVPEFFTRADDSPVPNLNMHYVLAALLCLVVGLKSKNLLLTTFVGIVAVALLRLFV